MEGLIPYIYRAIKRRKERKYFTRSMSTAASTHFFGVRSSHKFLRPSPIKLGGIDEGQNGHRRYRSLEDFSSELLSPEKVARPRGHLARVASSGMFACVTGGNWQQNRV